MFITQVYILDPKKCVVKYVLPRSQAISQSLGGSKQKLDIVFTVCCILNLRKAVGEPGNEIDTSSSYLHVLGVGDGDVVGEEPNPAVPTEVLTEILHLKEEISMEDVISRLRSRTVPPGYPYHTWRILSGKFALLN